MLAWAGSHHHSTLDCSRPTLLSEFVHKQNAAPQARPWVNPYHLGAMNNFKASKHARTLLIFALC